MLQTDRKTDLARQTAETRERTERRQSRDVRAEAALALEAILNGGSLEQLPAEGVLSLSRTAGNDALVSLLTLHKPGPDAGYRALPAGPCLTEPGEWSVGEPMTAQAPDFASFAPLSDAAPLAL